VKLLVPGNAGVWVQKGCCDSQVQRSHGGLGDIHPTGCCQEETDLLLGHAVVPVAPDLLQLVRGKHLSSAQSLD